MPLAVVDAEQRAGTVTRAEFGATQMQVLAETAVTASAAAVKAEIEAAFIVAMQRPRNLDAVYERIMRDCKRPSFANAAVYRLPRSEWNPVTKQKEKKLLKGLSIRFTEDAIRNMGNAVLKAQTLYDDDDKQIVQVVGLDLETNTRFEETCIISKTVERKKVSEGTQVIGSRRNSYGDTVYIVVATDDEFRMKRGAEISRARRNVGNQLIPADIRDDAMTACEATMLDKASKDPDSERKALILGFSQVGVPAEALAEYLGHSLTAMQPAELVEMRQLWRAIADGHTTWREAMEEKAEAEAERVAAENAEKAKADSKSPSPKASAADRLKSKVGASAPSKEQPAPASTAPAERERQPGDDEELDLR
jgi:hypothetical protein